MPDFSSVVGPHLESALDSGETLAGVCAATQQSAFKGRSVAVGVTDRRLLLAPLDRRGRPNGEVISIRPEEITGAKAQGAGGGWASVGTAVLDAAAVTIQLRTVNGDKYKLSLMRGTGIFGKLGGGEGQEAGIDALAAWFQRFARHE
jgi:hypothetical protein